MAVTKAKAKDRERPQITVATVIQKPGDDVKKKGVPKPNMKDKSKESQLLDVLKKYMPQDKVILAMFDELMTIMRKGGTQIERRKTIVVQREEKAVEDVMIAVEAQKAAEVERLIAAEKADEEERLKKEGERERLADERAAEVLEDRLRQEAAEVEREIAAEKAAEKERRKQKGKSERTTWYPDAEAQKAAIAADKMVKEETERMQRTREARESKDFQANPGDFWYQYGFPYKCCPCRFDSSSWELLGGFQPCLRCRYMWGVWDKHCDSDGDW